MRRAHVSSLGPRSFAGRRWTSTLTSLRSVGASGAMSMDFGSGTCLDGMMLNRCERGTKLFRVGSAPLSPQPLPTSQRGRRTP